MTTPVSQRVRKRRDALRAAGLRPVQIWLPDTRSAAFAEECRRQAARVARADAGESDVDDFLVHAAASIDGWE